MCGHGTADTVRSVRRHLWLFKPATTGAVMVVMVVHLPKAFLRLMVKYSVVRDQLSIIPDL